MDMSMSYESTGRTRQKERTRTALVDAARAILREGAVPTVERAADRAGISRTTAYRYFTNRRALLLANYPEFGASSLLGDAPPADPVERLELVAQRFTSQLIEHEPELRAQLRISLDGRRIGRAAAASGACNRLDPGGTRATSGDGYQSRRYEPHTRDPGDTRHRGPGLAHRRCRALTRRGNYTHARLSRTLTESAIAKAGNSTDRK